jgi:hypothetical protein
MFGINLKRSLATVAFAVGVLAAAGPASAATHQSGLVAYNGHAGLGSTGAPVAGIQDGTSNTVMFGVRAAAPGAQHILMADMGGQVF